MNRYENSALVPERPSPQMGLGPVRRNGDWGNDIESARIDFSELWDTLRRGKWIILATCLIVVGGVLAYTMTIPPVYRASSIVLVEPQQAASSQIASLGGVVGGDGTRSLERQLGLLRHSSELEGRVARRLTKRADSSAGELHPIMVGPDGEVLSRENIAARLSGRVSFSVLPSEALLEISATSQFPEEAALIANLYTKAYQSYARQSSRASLAAARTFLEEQLAKRKAEVQQLEEQWESFVRNNDVVTLGEDRNRLVEEYTSLEQQRDQLQFQLEQQRGSMEVLRQRLQDVQSTLSEEVQKEQAVASLTREIEVLDAAIAELKAEAEPYYINNPRLRGNESQVPELAAMKRKIEGYERRKDTLTQQLIARASTQEATVGEGNSLTAMSQLRSRIEEQEMQIKQTEEQIDRLNARIQSYQGDLQEIPSQTIRRQQLERQLEQARTFYRTVAEELRSTIIREESELGYVQHVRSAGVPAVPVSPDYRNNILLALLLGLGLGVGLAFVRQALNRELHDPEDVQDIGHSLVGVIPKMDREIKSVFDGKETVELGGKSVSTRLFPLLEPWSPISENYRLVRTNLQHTGGGPPPKVLLVTSPEISEGKTLTAVNVAITMAQSGRRTALVDADLRRPTAHTLLDINREPGLADFLDARSDSVEDVTATGANNLHVIPAGVTRTPPAEIFDSDRMRALIDRLKSTYDVVIIDSPPVLAVTDPVILAPQCDATLLVVSARQTDVRAIEIAEETLGAVGVSIAGVILNRHDLEKEGDRYSYGYKRGYTYD